jgi:hypothetical protein
MAGPTDNVTNTGPSSSQSPYLLPVGPNWTSTSILTTGDSVNFKPDGVTPYRLVGIPDGLGAYDNGNGTFTVLMNHEIAGGGGVARAHGSAGAFVSKWTIDKQTLQVLKGRQKRSFLGDLVWEEAMLPTWPMVATTASRQAMQVPLRANDGA